MFPLKNFIFHLTVKLFSPKDSHYCIQYQTTLLLYMLYSSQLLSHVSALTCMHTHALYIVTFQNTPTLPSKMFTCTVHSKNTLSYHIKLSPLLAKSPGFSPFKEGDKPKDKEQLLSLMVKQRQRKGLTPGKAPQYLCIS